MPTPGDGKTKRFLSYAVIALGLVVVALAFTETGSELAFDISNFARDLLNLL
jgi:hypothetical protein